MAPEKRLELLASRIAIERSNGLVQEWSEEIKDEALSLVELLGAAKVCAVTRIHRPSISVWQKKMLIKNKSMCSSDDESSLSVTRIVGNSSSASFEIKSHIVSVFRDKIELKIFCREFAEKIAERVLS